MNINLYRTTLAFWVSQLLSIGVVDATSPETNPTPEIVFSIGINKLISASAEPANFSVSYFDQPTTNVIPVFTSSSESSFPQISILIRAPINTKSKASQLYFGLSAVYTAATKFESNSIYHVTQTNQSKASLFTALIGSKAEFEARTIATHLNIQYRFQLNSGQIASKWEPWLEAGIGINQTKVSNYIINFDGDLVLAIPPELFTSPQYSARLNADSNSNWSPSAYIGAGVLWSFNKFYSLSLGYRYSKLGKLELIATPTAGANFFTQEGSVQIETMGLKMQKSMYSNQLLLGFVVKMF